MSSILYHHGIAGQKWHVKNGPPYPLGAKAHSSSEKKAGTKGWSSEAKRDIKSSSKQGNISKQTQNYRSKMIERYKKSNPKLAKEYEKKSEDELVAEYQRRKQMEKTILTAAAVVGVSAACYLAVRSNAIKQIQGTLESGQADKAKDCIKSSLDDLDYVFSKGTVMHRMVGYEDFNLDKTKGKVLYVSTKEADVMAYKSLLKDWSGTGKRYDIKLEAVQDIKAPSDKKARLIFDELWRTDPSYRDALNETIAKCALGSMNPTPEVLAEMKKKVANDVAADPFKHGIYAFVKQQGDSKKLVDKYKEYGYSAIIDYFDKGVMSESPLILFDASKDLKQTGKHRVFNDEKAKALYTLLHEYKDHPAVKALKEGGSYEILKKASIEKLKDYYDRGLIG